MLVGTVQSWPEHTPIVALVVQARSGQTRDTSVPRWVLKRQRSARASIGGTDPTGFKGTVHGPTGIPTSHPQAITVFTCIDTHQDSSLRRGPFCCGTRLAGGLILQGTD